MDGGTLHTGTEIRPITRAEAIDYLRGLPFAVGLPNWEPAPAAWYGGEGTWGPPPPPLTEEELEKLADEMMTEGFRPQAAFVDGRIVGGSAMLSLELTIPGPTCVPMGGVTSTGVIATHRRRGLLRGMMMAMLADAAPRPHVHLVTPVTKRDHWGNPGAHSTVKLFGRPYVLVTDEVYGTAAGPPVGLGCPWGWVRMIDIRDPRRPRVAAAYKIRPYNDPTYCPSVPRDREEFASFSSHNPTLTPHLAFVSWHSGGLQAVNIADPTHPRPVAAFLPRPLAHVQTEDPALSAGRDKVVMWSYPIVKDGLVYVVDIRNGLSILRYRGPFASEVARIRFLEGNSNLGAASQVARTGRADRHSLVGSNKSPEVRTPRAYQPGVHRQEVGTAQVNWSV